jgi:hypothetical protein
MTGPLRDENGRFVSKSSPAAAAAGVAGVTAGLSLDLVPDLGSAWRKSDECRDVVAIKAREVERFAVSLAPDNPRGPTADIHTSIRGEPVETEDGWIGRVSAFDFKSHWYEFGNSRHAARPYLRPAAEAAELTFEDPSA